LNKIIVSMRRSGDPQDEGRQTQLRLPVVCLQAVIVTALPLKPGMPGGDLYAYTPRPAPCLDTSAAYRVTGQRPVLSRYGAYSATGVGLRGNASIRDAGSGRD